MIFKGVSLCEMRLKAKYKWTKRDRHFQELNDSRRLIQEREDGFLVGYDKLYDYYHSGSFLTKGMPLSKYRGSVQPVLGSALNGESGTTSPEIIGE